jgi:hypothetical protein
MSGRWAHTYKTSTQPYTIIIIDYIIIFQSNTEYLYDSNPRRSYYVVISQPSQFI